MLLGKYAARPAIPYLASLAMLGLGIAGAVSPYLAEWSWWFGPRAGTTDTSFEKSQ
jgi:hypothetical protein